jgi:GR25 family glycosyltransferase involved in LPS biosynthesis
LGGTGGYMINPTGAKQLLDFIEKHGMTNAIDTVQQLFADNGNVFYVNPRIVLFEVNDDTDIQSDFDTSLEMSEKDIILNEADVWARFNIDEEQVLLSPSPLDDENYHTYQITKNIYVNIPLSVVTDENRKDLLLSRL